MWSADQLHMPRPASTRALEEGRLQQEQHRESATAREERRASQTCADAEPLELYVWYLQHVCVVPIMSEVY